ncbi:Calcineurin-like phosphoesterase [Lishizhenia tianjinensis]|uniref:Calcineurin-like phosphoesterase n=2 Tax=Lishizhenia tianjinensis TaxID=477690 RepID=A0A1I6XIQ5_9FLAO|nr:Calcineurin-like phosphoesterase [Lishizhenia tianjinensis]
MFYGDASTTATIGWDQLNVEAEYLYIDTLPLDTTHLNNCIDKFIQRKDKGMNNHFVELENLKADTRYYFCVKDKNGFSKSFYFHTVPNTPNTPLAFVAGGDSRTRSAVRRQANLLVAKLKPHAVLFDGDYTAIDTPNEWIQWFDDWSLTVGQDGRITPIVPSRGNHERTNKVMVNIFNVPSKRVYYSTQFGGGLLNLVVLNSEIWKGGAQTWFLRNNLEKHKDFTWSVPMYHRPMRPHVKHKKEMQTQYKHFVPVFEAYKNVRLAIECDSHTCKSTWPILKCEEGENCEEGFVRDDSLGIVYVGEGCWGAPPRAADDQKSWTRNADMNDSFKYIFVYPNKIEVRTILYSNAQEVEEVDPENRFVLPQGIQLWEPSNGAVVTIEPLQ